MGLFTRKPGEPAGSPNPPANPPQPPDTPSRAPAATAEPPRPPAPPPPPRAAPPPTAPKKDPAADERARKFQDQKAEIHRKLVEQLDMTKLAQNATDELRVAFIMDGGELIEVMETR